MMLIYSSFCIIILIQYVQSFSPRQCTGTLLSRTYLPVIRCAGTDEAELNNEEFTRWINPQFTKQEVDAWWNELGDSVVTIGDKGVQASHVNSILQYLYSHQRIRIKFSTDKIDHSSVVEALDSNEELGKIAEVLDLRKRGLMMGRKASAKSALFIVAKKESHGMCLDFFSTGHTCKFGPKCKYSHDVKMSDATQKLLLQHLASMKPRRTLNEQLLKEN